MQPGTLGEHWARGSDRGRLGSAYTRLHARRLEQALQGPETAKGGNKRVHTQKRDQRWDHARLMCRSSAWAMPGHVGSSGEAIYDEL